MLLHKIKTIFLIFLFIIFKSWSQKTNNKNIDFNFLIHFKESKSLILLDDIAIKYSVNKIIDYNLIKEKVKDSLGFPLVLIDKKKYHSFKAISSCNINDSISYYIFSHKSFTKKSLISNRAYVAIFKRDRLVTFRTIYSNYINEKENCFGSVFDDNKFMIFKIDKNEFEYFRIDGNGFVYESEKNIDFKDLYFKREKIYNVELATNFYKENRVLLITNKINNTKPNQSLNIISNNHYIIESTFLIDIRQRKDFKEFIYLNKLQSVNDNSIAYEVIKSIYDVDNKLLEYLSISDFFVKNNLPVINECILSNPDRSDIIK